MIKNRMSEVKLDPKLKMKIKNLMTNLCCLGRGYTKVNDWHKEIVSDIEKELNKK